MSCNAANPKEGGHVDVWAEKFLVRFGEIDKSDRMTLNAVFRFFQEAAISHAENLNVGREDMARTGQVWVLSRISVVVDRRPSYCEAVTVRSWPRGGEKLFAVRDFDIRDKDDIPVVSASSGWLIVDLQKRRPLRPQSVMDNLPQNTGLSALPPDSSARALESLPEQKDLQKTAERKALYTDVDFNGHVNNGRYIQWIEDSLDPKLLESANKMKFDINYMNEILSGEVTDVMSAPLDAGGEGDGCLAAFAFEGRKQGSADHSRGQAAFRAELRLY
jgi:acyl-ACP thioesterase